MARHGHSAAGPARLPGGAGPRLPRQAGGSRRRRLAGGAEPLLRVAAPLPQPGHSAAVSACAGWARGPRGSRAPPRGVPCLTPPTLAPPPGMGNATAPKRSSRNCSSPTARTAGSSHGKSALPATPRTHILSPSARSGMCGPTEPPPPPPAPPPSAFPRSRLPRSEAGL